MNASGGTIGALAGLGFGLAEYVVVTRMIGRAIAMEAKKGGEFAGVELFERRMRPIKAVMLAGAFVVMPAVGYVVGDTFGP